MHGLPVGGWTGGWGAAVRGASNYAVYDRTGGPVKSEEVPLDLDPPTTLADGLAAMRHLQEVVLNATRTEGIVLSYGGLSTGRAQT